MHDQPVCDRERQLEKVGIQRSFISTDSVKHIIIGLEVTLSITIINA